MKILLKAVFSSNDSSKKHTKWLIFSFLLLIGMTIADQLEIMTLGAIIDASRSKSLDSQYPLHRILAKIKSVFACESHKVQKVAAALLVVALIKASFLFFSRYMTRILAIKISSSLRQQYFAHIQKLSMNFYEKYNIGSLSSRVVGDASQIAVSINSLITNYLHTPIAVFLTLSLCFYLSWRLSLIVFLGIPLIIFPVRWVATKTKKIARNFQKNQETFASVLIDFLAGIQTVKIFSMETYTLRQYLEQNDEMENLEIKTARYDLITRPILHFVTMFCLVIVLFIGLYLMKMEFGELVVFCGLLHLFYEPIRKFSDGNACIQRGIVAAERLFEVLQIEPEIVDEKDATAIELFEKKISFDNVWFRYGTNQCDSEWTLAGVSFEVNRGETVAIVGSTGSGKSTILQLIPRLYGIERGEIRIDGRSISKYTQNSLRKLISYVPQKPFLFNDTIYNNIAYGKKISKKELFAAAKKAQVHDFILALPQQYETMVIDMGKNFSGGQQQRIAIARALLRNSPILILDEATSSLDALNELKIKEAIENLRGEVTQILVAHRLSTIEKADKIIFLDRGRKIAEGTKKELLEICPPFKAMWEASAKPFQIEEIEAISSSVSITSVK